MSVRRPLVTLAALAGTVLLGACASIPQRAIDNGRLMDPQRPLQLRSSRDMQQLRSGYYHVAPLRSLYRTKPYTPFRPW